jgi:hypothetical protein
LTFINEPIDKMFVFSVLFHFIATFVYDLFRTSITNF